MSGEISDQWRLSGIMEENFSTFTYLISLNLWNFNQHRLTSTLNGLNHLNSNNLTMFPEFSLVITLITHLKHSQFTHFQHSFNQIRTKRLKRLLEFFSENILRIFEDPKV